MKPIFFNTEMVRAILDGRKTVTRRVIKPAALGLTYEDGSPARKPPYRPGSVMYVKETWAQRKCADCQDYDCGPDIMRKWRLIPCYDGIFLYKATDFINRPIKWRPSIHMPKEAARIFLRVTDVRVERLQDIMESPPGPENQIVREGCKYGCDFIAVWNNTIKKADLPLYGWVASPWVWAIEFERISKEEAYRE